MSAYNKGITISMDFIYKSVILVYICAVYLYLDQRAYLGILCMVVLAVYYITRRKKPTLYMVWSFLFVGICFLSYFWSQEPNPTKTLYNARAVLQVLILGNLLIAFIDRKDKIDFFMNALVIGGVILVVKLALFVPLSEWGNDRLGSEELNLNANFIGLALSISAICALNLVQKDRSLVSFNNIASFKKVFYLLLICLFAFVVIMTGSRKAFLLLILGCGMLLYVNIKKGTHKMMVIPIVLLLCIVGFELVMNVPLFYDLLGNRLEGLINLFTGKGKVDDSAMVRMLLIEKGLELYHYRPYLGYGVTSFTNISGFGFYAHNNYIELLVGVGLIGTIIYYIIYLYIIIKLTLFWRQKKYVGNIMLVIVLLLAVMEYGLVSYYDEFYQLIIAFAFAIINCYNTNKVQ